MSGESNVRFYLPNGERVSHTPKAAHKDDGLPRFVWNVEDDVRYRKITTGDIWDEETQMLLPSHALPARILSSERYWEALCDESGNQIKFPSVTQTHNILANEGVVRWQVNNVIKFFTDFIAGETTVTDDMLEAEENEFLASLASQANAASSPPDASERGTRFHSAMELFLKGDDWTAVLNDDEVEPCRNIIAGISEELFKRHGKNWMNGAIEKSFTNPEIGVAGCADFSFAPNVYDWKFSDKVLFGKRGGLLKTNWCFKDRALQLAAYADGLKIENPTLTNVFCNVATGQVCFYDWPNTQRWMDAYRLLTMFYYKFHLGRFPALGDNTAMIAHTLEDWRS